LKQKNQKPQIKRNSKAKNLAFIKKPILAYGGDLRKKAENRGPRPLVFRSGSMHITLRSLMAKGIYSFQHSSKRQKVKNFVYSFSQGKGVKILSYANVGNHIHLHVKLHNQALYFGWIRGLSSGLAMISHGLEGLKKLKDLNQKFWDQRPFSRVIRSFKHFLNTKSYVEVNILEGMGMPRAQAELLIFGSRRFFKSG
jgi:REP element-mobilizing transposase RayT